MKRIWKNILILSLFILSIFGFIGCKNKTPEVTEGNTLPTVKTETEPTENTEKTVVTPTKTETIEKIDLDVIFDSNEHFVGEEIGFTLINKETLAKYTEYQVFISDGSILKYENNSLISISDGSSEVTFVITINGESYSVTKEIVVSKKPVLGDFTFETNIPEHMYSFQTVKSVTLTLNPGNINITDFKVKISDDDILDYMKDNSLEAIDNGTCTVTFTFTYQGNEYIYIKEVNVNDELHLQVNYDNEISVGEKVNIEVVALPENVTLNEYTLSSISKFVSLDNNEITGIEPGDAIVYLKAEYLDTTLSSTLKIKVKEVVVEELRNNLSDVMFINEEKEVNCYLYPSKTIVNNFTISSSDENIISVNGQKINALGSGEVKLTITDSNNLSCEKVIFVEAFNGVELEVSDDINCNQVEFYHLVSKGSKRNIDDVQFSVSNNDVLLVNNKAIFAKSCGEAILTVSYDYLGTIYSDSKTIKVTEKEYKIERITVDGSAGVLIGTETQLNVTKIPSYGIGEIVFSSSDSSIATIDSNGVIKGVSTGYATMTVSVKDSDISIDFNIKVIEKKDDVYIDGGEYSEDHIIRYNELSKGVIQTTYWSYTRTALEGIDVDGYSGLDGIIDNDLWYSQCVNILTVPSSKEIKVIPWANLNGNVWNLTTVKGLIENFEKYNPGVKVIAAVNGDFFDINANKNLPYSTTGENISDGEFYKTSNWFSPQGGTIGFTNDGSNVSLIGGYGATRTSLMILSIYDEYGNIIKEFNNVYWNTDTSDNDISVWYGTYNDNKNYVSQVVSGEGVYVVENADRAIPNFPDDFYGKGTITNILDSYDLQVGQFAIKTKNEEVKSYLKEGVKIRVQFEFTGDWASVISATGYNQKVYDDTYEVGGYEGTNLGSRAPRTVIGMREDGTLVMMVVDGRQGATGMFGCDGWECAAIMKAYGCIKAYNVDGGGSTTMVIRTESGLQVLNSPSDGHERSDGNCILICSVDPDYKSYVHETSATTAKISVSTDVKEFASFPTYVLCNGELFATVDGVATITGLVHNQVYPYQIYYKDGDEYYKTLSIGSFTTQKSGFEFLGVTIEETNDAFIINAYAIDKDIASNINSMSISLNGLETKLSEGTISLKKSIFGDSIDNIQMSFYYTENGTTYNNNLDINDCFIMG